MTEQKSNLKLTNTILERARISGNALNKVEKPVLARILNHCMKVTSGDALLRLSEGKISAVHGGDRTDYAVLEIPELFSKTVEYLQENFPQSELAGGYYDHSLVTALLAFPKQSILLRLTLMIDDKYKFFIINLKYLYF